MKSQDFQKMRWPPLNYKKLRELFSDNIFVITSTENNDELISAEIKVWGQHTDKLIESNLSSWFNREDQINEITDTTWGITKKQYYDLPNT